MSGKKRYERSISALAGRKTTKPQYFSGQLGVTTGGENVVEVTNRPGFVWVKLRNQLNELIQAFNDEVSPVFDLPVMVEWDQFSPNRYRIVGRDTGRYHNWGSSSAYLPVHGAQHQFNTFTMEGGGDIVWVYGQQLMPALITPSGTAGADSVSMQPYVYLHSGSFHFAGGTGISIGTEYNPTGTANARMLLVYLDQDTGNPGIATGSLTEFVNTNTGTATIVPYIPAPINDDDLPLAGLRVITGTSTIMWANLYDVRQFI